MQDAAALAMRDGLMRYDGGRGWSDLNMKVDLAKDWPAQLDREPGLRLLQGACHLARLRQRQRATAGT